MHSKFLFCLIFVANVFSFSDGVAAQSTEVMNKDSLIKYYPERTPWDRSAPAGFLSHRPAAWYNTNWLLVESINSQDIYLDLTSIKEKRKSAFSYVVLRITNVRNLRLYNKLIVEEYSWRELNCARGGSIVVKSVFRTEQGEYLEFVHDSKNMPFVPQDKFQIDIACARI